MTDEEALKEIERQEKRFAAAKCGRGLQLAKSAREYYQTIVKCRQKSTEVSRRRSAVAKLRKVVRNGELIRNQEHKARLMFEEKVKRLATMPVE